MTLQIVKVDEENRAVWDKMVSTFPFAHPLNAYGWGKVRQIDGWQSVYFVAKEEDIVKGMIMVLIKKIPWTSFSIMYAPKGPVCDPENSNVLKSLINIVRDESNRYRTIFLRIDPNIAEDRFDNSIDPFVEAGFVHLEHRWSFWNSPRDVYRIDLSTVSTEEDLFNSIDRDARRCVRKAEKEGVSIRPAETLEELHKFYEIFSQFSVRKGFMCRQAKYQELLWNEYIVKGNGRLFLAIYNEEIIGGLICLLFNNRCLAMHMGTQEKYNKLQTNYAYVWESIRWAKERGCLWYSFRGIGTTPTQESFKRKFRPQAVALVGYYDFPFKPLIYKVFYKVEFEVLPRVWRTIMRARRIYKRIENKVIGLKACSDLS